VAGPSSRVIEKIRPAVLEKLRFPPTASNRSPVSWLGGLPRRSKTRGRGDTEGWGSVHPPARAREGVWRGQGVRGGRGWAGGNLILTWWRVYPGFIARPSGRHKPVCAGTGSFDLSGLGTTAEPPSRHSTPGRGPPSRPSTSRPSRRG